MGYKLAGALAVMLMMLCGVTYWYYNDTQARIAILQDNNAKLETAVATNEETIISLQADYAAIQATNQALNEEFANIRRQNQVLADKLAKHDLGVLGAGKPTLVERIINRATDKAGRCFELLSGAKLTEEELNAENANKFNSECPWLYDSLVVPNRVQSVDPAPTTN
jgi:cell division protein FtsB